MYRDRDLFTGLTKDPHKRRPSSKKPTSTELNSFFRIIIGRIIVIIIISCLLGWRRKCCANMMAVNLKLRN